MAKAASNVIDMTSKETYKGVRVVRVNVKLLTAYLKKVGVQIPKVKGKTDVQNAIDAYTVHVEAIKERGEEGPGLVMCDVADGGCGALSGSDLEGCPVCGSTDEESGEAAEVVVEADEVEVMDQASIEVHKQQAIQASAERLADLDARLNKIRNLMVGTVTNQWELGREINEILEQGLYKERRDEAGDQSFKDFWDFLTVELGITKRYALNLQAYAKMFTPEDFARIGPAKITVIAQVSKHLPPGERERLLEHARAGTSLKNLKKEAERIVPMDKRKPVTAVGGAAGETVARKSPEPRKGQAPEKGQITQVFTLGKTELKMSGKGGKDTILEVTEELTNNVQVSYTINLKTKILTIVRSRGE